MRKPKRPQPPTPELIAAARDLQRACRMALSAMRRNLLLYDEDKLLHACVMVDRALKKARRRPKGGRRA